MCGDARADPVSVGGEEGFGGAWGHFPLTAGHFKRTKQGSGGGGWSHLRWDTSGVRPPRPGQPGTSAPPPASRSARAPPAPGGTCCRGRGGREAREEDSRARSMRHGLSPQTRSAHAPPWPWPRRITHTHLHTHGSAQPEPGAGRPSAALAASGTGGAAPRRGGAGQHGGAQGWAGRLLLSAPPPQLGSQRPRAHLTLARRPRSAPGRSAGALPGTGPAPRQRGTARQAREPQLCRTLASAASRPEPWNRRRSST